jgi:hypothetical protein
VHSKNKTRGMNDFRLRVLIIYGEMPVPEAVVAEMTLSGDIQLPFFSLYEIVECVVQVRCFIADFFGNP